MLSCATSPKMKKLSYLRFVVCITIPSTTNTALHHWPKFTCHLIFKWSKIELLLLYFLSVDTMLENIYPLLVFGEVRCRSQKNLHNGSFLRVGYLMFSPYLCTELSSNIFVITRCSHTSFKSTRSSTLISLNF